jgi:S1-C subfamily serine protease
MRDISARLALAFLPPRADGEAVIGVDDLIRLLNSGRIGRGIAIDVLRRGTLRSFDVTPSERPVLKAA